MSNYPVYDPNQAPWWRTLLVNFGHLLMIAGCGFFIWYSAFRDPKAGKPASVIIDNATNQGLRLTLNGQEWARCAPGQTGVERELPGGEHTIVVVTEPSGRELDRLSVTIDQNKHTYVLNLLGAQVYERGMTYYGDLPSDLRNVPQPSRTQQKWFEANVDDLFKASPATVHTSSSMPWSTRSYLRRAAGGP